MDETKNRPLAHDPADAAAEEWFVRRDRGLNAVEQAAYSRWLDADPRHPAAFARVEKLWRALDPAAATLRIDTPSTTPLLRHPWWWAFPLAAAAAIAAIVLLRAPDASQVEEDSPVVFHPGPERRMLPDGSVMELAANADVQVEFTPDVRSVRLVRGMAFFTVAKDPAIPFVVSTEEVAVRALGTAFSVSLDPKDVSVLVTEGRVRVEETPSRSPAPQNLSTLDAGQQGIIARVRSGTQERQPMSVTRLTPAEMERALAWQFPRLEFSDLPLATVVKEFNRYSPKKLVVGDAATAAIRIGGRFRADRLEPFLRALEAGFDISASPDGQEIILRRSKPSPPR